jgi:hypothetical protein
MYIERKNPKKSPFNFVAERVPFSVLGLYSEKGFHIGMDHNSCVPWKSAKKSSEKHQNFRRETSNSKDARNSRD